MRKTIHRAAVGIDGPEKHMLPRGARIVHVDTRNADGVEFWYEFEVSNWANREIRVFQIHGTGHEFNGLGEYVGSVLTPETEDARRHLPRGALVWHLYEYPYEEEQHG